MPDEKPKSRSFASAAKLGARAAKLAARLKAEREARTAAEKERDELKARPDAAKLEETVKQYRDKERASKHRAAFDRAAKDAKVRPEALDDLWELAKLDTSAEEPDAQAIGSAVAEKAKARPYLLDAQGGGDAPTPEAPLTPGPGSGRGGRSQNGGMTVKRSDLADGAWMRENQDRLQEAQAQGLVAYVD